MYRNDLRIMLITGYNKQSEWNNGQFDYFSLILVEYGDGQLGKEHGITMILI